jgi:hypothetical protein
LEIVGEVCVDRFHNFTRSILIELVAKVNENAGQPIGHLVAGMSCYPAA